MDLKIDNKITKQQQQQISGFPTWIERTKWDHLHPLIKLFIPIKSLQYYNDYYRFIRIVHRCNRINGKLLNENLYNRLYRFYQTMVTVQLLKFVHLIILYLSRNYTDNMIKVLQGDLSDLFQMNQFIQLLTAFPMMLGLKNFEQLFIRPFHIGNFILSDLLFSNNHPEQRYFMQPYKIYDYSAINCLKWIGWSCTNSVQIFIPILHIMTMVLFCTEIEYLIENRHYFHLDDLTSLYSIIILLLLILLIIIVTIIGHWLIFFFINTTVLMGCQVIMTIFFIWIRLWQAEHYLRSIMKKSDIYTVQCSLKKFIKFQRQTLMFIFMADKFHSKSFLWIMFITLPINSFAINELVSGSATKSIILLLASHEWIIIFGLHLLVAKINERIYLSNKSMFGLLTRKRRCLVQQQSNSGNGDDSKDHSFRLNLQCNYYLQTMYTENRYGFTYGSICLVSIQSFVMLTIGYVEGTLFIYKLFNNI
ncbi:hypothetical protein DERP_013787 [Dermatophagoides pteronyssinus]|uniref:Odorant receptor n=1 Tax=Dermatophagoides pteronyssinus TaxID=6956 RepID=A0ABQ8JFY4_DERPT|nr:hypothetical protein DERP_013787 [Dermatophagoides pteronyssinus]